MRLATRLILPHAIVTSILAIAILFIVVALARITSLVGEIQSDYLTDLGDEERLHRAAWELEVALRRGTLTCKASDDHEEDVVQELQAARVNLDNVLRTYESGTLDHLGRAAESYAARASRVLEHGTCQQLRELADSPERLVLDEDLTNAWIARVHAIRVAFEQKETEIQRLGATAISSGIVLVVVSGLAAAGVARNTARGIAKTLAGLAKQARRVGEGDFTPLLPVEGPNEVRALALDLDRMRSRLAEVEHLKHSFVASVSHDLRTPLARLREALALLSDGSAGPLNDRQRRIVTLARSACEREIRLVSALLDLSRLRSGRPIKRDPGSSVDDVIARAVEDVTEEATEAGVAVSVDMPAIAPRAALDGPLVERALVNLLSNAISFSKKGQSVSIERSLVTRGEPEVTWVEIFVRDHGPGVAPELRERLFEPYATGGASQGRSGIGLGLSIAREMIRAHGGDLVLVAEARVGATFCIRLPLTDYPHSSTQSPAPPRSAPMRVLSDGGDA